MFDNGILSLLLLFSGPLVVAAVTGAWLAAGRLFAMRCGGVRLPVWAPWVITTTVLMAGLVIAATEFIGATGQMVNASANMRGAGLFTALLLSPAWLAGASLAVLGMALHYVLDPLLAAFPINPVVTEGLSRGFRAAWAVIGLLTLLMGLFHTYNAATRQFGFSLHMIVAQGNGPYMLLVNVMAIGLGIFGMIAPWLIERDSPPA